MSYSNEAGEAENRYKRLFELSRDGILVLDAVTGQISDANPYIEDLLGYGLGELNGKTLWDVPAFDELADSQVAFNQLVSQDRLRLDDLTLTTKEHKFKQVELVGHPLFLDCRKVFQCSIRDVTAQKNAEAAFQRANNELMSLVIELQWRDNEMKLLNKMNGLLLTCTTMVEAYKVVELMGPEIFAGQSGLLATTGDNQELQVVAAWGQNEISKKFFSMETCWAMRSGQPFEVVDPKSSLICAHFDEKPEGGYLCTPLTVQGETFGLLSIMDLTPRRGEHQLSHQQLASSVAESIKLCLSNLKLRESLREQAIHDPLTGLFNRRYLEETLVREIHRSQRSNVPLGIAMLDLDNFKGYNDSHGHDAGDTLLKEMGLLLSERLRKSDIACRYGGEEFVLVLPDCSVDDARMRVEQIREVAHGLSVRDGQQILTGTTLSAGIAGAPEHGNTARQLLAAADEALYKAKEGGRDRVVLYGASMM